VSSEPKAGKDAGELAGLDISTGTNWLRASTPSWRQSRPAVYTAMADNRLVTEKWLYAVN
jgi:4-hydroxy-tetrahydrodipicolinate reductase